MKLYLARHGLSQANTQRLLAGNFDTPLASPEGENQAMRLGERLRLEKIDVAFSSHLVRAKRTAELALKHHSIPVNIETRLAERCWGVLEARPVNEYLKEFEASGLTLETYAPRGGESLLQLRERVQGFLIELTETYQGKNVFLAAHHSVNKCLLSILLDYQWDNWQSLTQDNSCLNLLHIEKGKPARVEYLNCTAHLGVTEEQHP